MSDIFGGFDVAGAPELGIPDGPHPGKLVKFGRELSQKGDPYVVFYYSLQGITLQEWKGLPPSGDPTTWDRTVVDDKGRTEYDRNMQKLSFIQDRLKALGVPKERMNTVRSEDLAQMDVIVTTKKNDRGFATVANAVAKPTQSAGNLPQAAPATTPAVTTTPVVPPQPVGGGDVSNPFAGNANGA